MISPAQLPAYLVGARLITPETVVDPGILIRPAPGRHVNLTASIGDRGAFFVKQASDELGRAYIYNEATILSLLPHRVQSVSAYLPPTLQFDASNHVLITELVKGEDLDRAAIRGRIGVRLCHDIGSCLAALHSGTIGMWSDFSGTEIPWALALHRLTPSYWCYRSHGVIELSRLLQSTGIGATFDRLAGEWRRLSVVHGDVKWSNLVMRPPKGAGSRLILADWETAAFGDPLWDVGSVLGMLLRSWADREGNGLRFAHNEPPSHWLQRRARAFLTGYRAGAGDLQAPWPAVIRAVEFAAVRLVQTASESLAGSTAIAGPPRQWVQVAHNILKNPQAAAIQLLGIDP